MGLLQTFQTKKCMTNAKLPNQKKAYKDLSKRLNTYTRKVLAIYEVLSKESAKIATSTDYDGDGEFSFADYPKTSKKVDAMLDYYYNNMRALVYSGISNEWKNSDTLQDLLAKRVIKTFTRKIGNAKKKAYYEHNNAAKKAFIERKVKGLNLSQRIWNQRDDIKEALEKCLSTGIEKGMSAVKLSKKVSKYLNDYPSLAKDYKKKFGKAVAIQNCEYRSARLARNEINMAYRSAEQERWAKMDYIKGKEIKTTNNTTHKSDMCDFLAGIYPKGFCWTGWHVNCMCYAIPVIISEEDYWSGKQSSVTIPQNFTDWIKDNEDKVQKSSYLTQYVNFLESKPKEVRIASGNTPEARVKLRKFINETIQKKFKEVELPDGQTAKRLYLKNAGEEFVVGKNFFSETMAKNIRNKKLSETLQVAANVNDWFPNAKFERIENGKHHKFQFKVFHATFQGKQIECKAKLTSENILYTMRLLS